MNETARRAFVERLRAKRLGLGLRLEDIAQQLGVSNMTVHRWEVGKRVPQVAMAERWAAVLGVRVVGGSLAELFRRDVPACGTRPRYRQHVKRGERCPECWAAHAGYNTATYHRRRAQAVSTGGGAA